MGCDAATIAEAATVWVDAAAVATVDEAAAIEVPGRVEAVAVGVPEEAVTREPGVAVRAASPVPARVETRGAGVLLSESDVGFAEILGAQTAPTIEIILGLCLVLVEGLRLDKLSSEGELMSAFDIDGLDVGLEIGSWIDGCFAIEDADGGAAGVKSV